MNFQVPVDRNVDANSVRAFGPGLEPNNCRANIPQRFKIDATKSGKAPLAVDIRSEKGPLAQKPEVIDHGDGTYDVTYMPPPENSTCKVRVTYGGKDIPKRWVNKRKIERARQLFAFTLNISFFFILVRLR